MADIGGGGGAGGFRMSNDLCMPAPTTSPLANPTGITVSATAFPITVGAGGAGIPGPSTLTASNPGSISIFSSITSAGGGGGGASGNPSPSPANGGGLVEQVIDVMLERQETHLLLVRLKVIMVEALHMELQVAQLGVWEEVVVQVR